MWKIDAKPLPGCRHSPRHAADPFCMLHVGTGGRGGEPSTSRELSQTGVHTKHANEHLWESIPLARIWDAQKKVYTCVYIYIYTQNVLSLFHIQSTPKCTKALEEKEGGGVKIGDPWDPFGITLFHVGTSNLFGFLLAVEAPQLKIE